VVSKGTDATELESFRLSTEEKVTALHFNCTACSDNKTMSAFHHHNPPTTRLDNGDGDNGLLYALLHMYLRQV
jgi:hypothetical protein